jgi:hypothetical protein
MNLLNVLSRARAAIALSVGLMSACGGVDGGGTGLTADTSSAGRITGFGSVIVNAVRFDDTQARIVDDDGASHVRSDLKLGMVVEVEAGDVQGAGTASASGVARKIQFGNEIVGPVESVDTATGRLVVLGQAVQVDADTLFGSYARGLLDVAAPDLVEVFAFYDPVTAVYTATRIERQTTLTAFKLRGRIAALERDRFTIGGAVIDYSAIVPPALPKLANGLSVRVSLQTSPVAGRWVATTVHASQRSLPEASRAELEGFISGFVSSASFQVGGVPVDASGPGVSWRHGSVNQLADGVRVDVEGDMRNGVLVARKVDFKKAGGGDNEFELHGAVESVDAATQSFVLRGVTVVYDARTVFAAGTAAGLVVGAQLDVKGAPSPGGASLLARMIRYEK